jgi:hypothetical protein
MTFVALSHKAEKLLELLASSRHGRQNTLWL